jgi:viroplasmin and RNaseH domain-containing protein
MLEEMLNNFELEKKNVLIDEGLKECKELLGKQKTANDYFFYEGSIEGFEECKYFIEFTDFRKRLEELHFEEIREISKSSLKNEILREYFKIYRKDEETDYEKVFKIKGIKTQISFVYEKLMLYRGLREMIDEIQIINYH